MIDELDRVEDDYAFSHLTLLLGDETLLLDAERGAFRQWRRWAREPECGRNGDGGAAAF